MDSSPDDVSRPKLDPFQVPLEFLGLRLVSSPAEAAMDPATPASYDGPPSLAEARLIKLADATEVNPLAVGNKIARPRAAVNFVAIRRR